MDNATSTTVQGNFVGTDVAGTRAIPNGIDGIAVDGGGNNTIGGTATGAGNLASGNITRGSRSSASTSPSTTGNVVQRQHRRHEPRGTRSIPNGLTGRRRHPAAECHQHDGHREPELGQPNGLRINGAVSTGNTVQGNYIGTDRTGASAIPNTSVS